MIHVLIEEVWSAPIGTYKGTRLGPPRFVDDKPSREEAELEALRLMERFQHHGFNDRGRYWWGQDADRSTEHRLMMLPATP